MSTSDSPGSHDPQDESAAWDVAFLERVMRFQDGALSGEQLAEFEAELRGDEGKRQAFAELQMQSAVIHETLRRDAFASEEELAFAPQRQVLSGSENRLSDVLRFVRTWLGPMVAIGLIVAILLRPGSDVAPPVSNSQNSGEAIGRLARTSAVSWSGTALQVGDRLQAGRVKLSDGTAEFDFDNGVRMVLTGPAEIELPDAMHA
ncbi:MAG: hypothetical protein FJ302_04335, partial [Planctomycetes bacterium]|nr:hypothetical protein [Planctomycetota bacterium]